MSDPASAAKSARESLARALGAIQSDPSVPPGMMSIAEPISNAMGALFQIERSGGSAAAKNGPLALEATRRALGLLQQQPSNHPAVQKALEAVAGSLSLIHGLAAGKQSGPPAQAQQPGPPAARPQAPAPQKPHPPPAQPQAVQPQAPPTAEKHRRSQPAEAGGGAPVLSPQAYAATHVAAPAHGSSPQGTPYQPTVLAQPPVAAAASTAVAPQNGPTGRVDAELGTHSSSNFYKGLSGNDVVEHGGIFVSTYNIPRVGQSITVHVSMPGGYEFDALAVVRWTRDTVDSSSGQNAPPGFGAQFTQITPEARQLVYRYVRNREPLFHDDL